MKFQSSFYLFTPWIDAAARLSSLIFIAARPIYCSCSARCLINEPCALHVYNQSRAIRPIFFFFFALELHLEKRRVELVRDNRYKNSAFRVPCISRPHRLVEWWFSGLGAYEVDVHFWAAFGSTRPSTRNYECTFGTISSSHGDGVEELFRSRVVITIRTFNFPRYKKNTISLHLVIA